MKICFIYPLLTIHLSAAAISPTLVMGPDSIDPTGGRNNLNLTVTGAATKSALEGTTDYGVVQNWSGLTATTGTVPTATGINYLTFTDRPDASFSFVGESGRNAGSGTGGAASYTSGPSTPAGSESLFFGTDPRNVLTIEFGDYDSMTSSFAANAGVSAAGFTFSRNTAATTGTTWIASFYDGATVLSSQTVSAGTATNVAALFGYIAGAGEKITKITIGGTGSGYDAKNHFIDDFGFAAIPEPGTTLLGSLGLLALLRRRR